MSLHAGSAPDGQHPWRCLFNTDAFYALRGETAWHEVLVDDAGNVLGDLTFSTSGGVSGWSAPFGGPDWRREYWRPEQIRDGLQRVIGRALWIRCKPPSYGENEAATVQALLADGWLVKSAELNYWIPVPATIDEYEASLSRQARAAIDHGSEDLGLETVELGPKADLLWLRAYQVLRDNREAKGRKISLDFEYVLAIRDAFPGLVRMLVALTGDGQSYAHDVVAAALVYRVGAGRDVVQFWGDDPEAKLKWSPMNLLVRDTVQHCIQTGARVLDLGISTEDGVPNGGLCRFKRSVGARAEARLVLGA